VKSFNDFARPALVLAGLASAVFLATCVDFGTSPVAGSPIHASFALAPVYPANAHGAVKALADVGLPLDRVRIVITRPGTNEVLKDTTITIHAGDPAITLELTVPALAGEKLDAGMQFKSGETVLFEGHAPVTALSPVATSGGGAAPVTITVSYVGPGAKAKKVIVTPTTSYLPANAPTTFTAQAFDSTDAAIPNTPFTWTLNDSTLGTIDANGGFTPAGKRGLLFATAATLNNVSGAAVDSLIPPAAKIVIVSGDKQSATPLIAVAQPLVVAVRAADDLGVPNQTVTFAATDGGTITPASVVTDASGNAQATLKVAGKPGAYNFTATSGAFSVGASATAITGPAKKIAIFGGATQSASPGASVGVKPSVIVTDTAANPVSGVAVVFAVASGGGAATGGSQTTGTNGVAQVTNWVTGSTPGTNTMTATATGLAGSPLTFTATTAFGALHHFTVTAPNGSAIGTQVAGTPFNVLISAVDAGGGIIGNYAGTPTIGNLGNATLSAGGGVTPAFTNGTLTQSLTFSVGGVAQLTVTDGAVSSTIGAFNVQLVTSQLTLNPAGGAVTGQPFVTQPKVSYKDPNGNLVTTDTNSVTATVSAGATLVGTTTVKPVNGVATFTNLGISGTPGASFTLTFTRLGLTVAQSNVVPSSLANVWNQTTGNWSTAAGWSLGRVPVATDSVVIGGTSTYTLTMDVDFTSSSYIIVGGTTGTQTLSMPARTLTMGGSMVVGGHGVLTAVNSNILPGSPTPKGRFLNQGQTTLDGSTILDTVTNAGLLVAANTAGISGPLTTVTGSIIRVGQLTGTGGLAGLVVANGFTNNGTIELTNQATGANNAVLSIASGTLSNAAAASIHIMGGTTPGGSRGLSAVLSNQGSFVVDAPLFITQNNPGAGNGGTMNVNANVTLTLAAGASFTNTGNLTAAGGDTLAVVGGNFNSNSGTLGGAGALSLTTTIASIQNSISIGAMVLSSSSLSISSALSTSTTALSLSSSTLGGTGTLTNVSGVTVKLLSSTISAPLVNQGTLIASGSSSITGGLTTSTGSLLQVGQLDASSSTATLTVSSGFTNNGTLELTNLFTGNHSATLSVNGTLSNAGTIASKTGTANGTRTFAAELNNLSGGIVTGDFGALLTIQKPGAHHSNSGTINVTANIVINDGGTAPQFVNNAGGTINVGSDNSLSITGDSVNNAGTFSGNGNITLTNLHAAFPTVPSSGNWNLNGTTLWIGGPMSNAPPMNIFPANSHIIGNASASMTNVSTNAFSLNSSVIDVPFHNDGALYVTGASVLGDTLYTGVGAASLIHIASGDATTSLSSLAVAKGFENNGTIELGNDDVAGNPHDAKLSVTSTTGGFLKNTINGTIKTLDGYSTSGARTLAAVVDNFGTIDVNVGSATAGTLIIANSFTMESGSTANMDLLSQTSNDMIVSSSGTVALKSGSTFNMSLLGSYDYQTDPGTHWTLVSGASLSMDPSPPPTVMSTPATNYGWFKVSTGTTFYVVRNQGF